MISEIVSQRRTMAKLIFCLFGLLASSSAILDYKQLPLVPGHCLKNVDLPVFKPEEFFDGHWYEYKSLGNYIFQSDGTCRSMQAKVKGDVLNVLYYQYQRVFKTYTSLKSTTNVTDITGSSFVLHYKIGGLFDMKVPLTVMATDYRNYAILYSCKESLGLKSESVWLMTRKRGDDSFDEDFVDFLSSEHLDYNEFDLVPTTGCGPQEPTM